MGSFKNVMEGTLETWPRDPMEVAYLTAGALQTWQSATDAQRDTLEGQESYIYSVIQAAPALAGLRTDAVPMWYYEITEPTGEAIGKAILEGRDYDVETIARDLIQSAT